MTLLRTLFFLAVIIVAATGPVPLLFVAAAVYALSYTAYELLFVAACIDAYYGTGTVPYYLLATTLIIFFIELLRPHIKVRERSV